MFQINSMNTFKAQTLPMTYYDALERTLGEICDKYCWG